MGRYLRGPFVIIMRLLKLPLVVFVATSEMHLEPIWEKAPPTVMAGHEYLLVVLFVGLGVVLLKMIVAIVHLRAQ